MRPRRGGTWSVPLITALMNDFVRHAIPASVVLSLGLGGHDEGALQSCMRRALAFTEDATHIIVHASAKSRPHASAKGRPQHQWLDRWIKVYGRVHLNPRSLRVQRSRPSVLAAHLSNLEWCRSLRVCADHSKFVLLAANSPLLRVGIEAIVLSHSLSFCVGFQCTDVHLRRDADAEAALSQLVWTPSSPLRRRVLDALLLLEDSALSTDAYFASFTQLLRDEHVRGWNHAPLNAFPHEGSFFPAWLLDEFQRALQETVWSRAMAEDAECKSSPHCCACCELYGRYVRRGRPTSVVGEYACLQGRRILRRVNITEVHASPRSVVIRAYPLTRRSTRPLHAPCVSQADTSEYFRLPRICAAAAAIAGQPTPLPMPSATAAVPAAVPAAVQPRPAAAVQPRPVESLARESATTGGCQLEELLLPTFVWQHHPELVQRAAPPLVVRVWPSESPPRGHRGRHERWSIRAAAERIRNVLVSKAIPGLAHAVALKVPQTFLGNWSLQ